MDSQQWGTHGGIPIPNLQHASLLQAVGINGVFDSQEYSDTNVMGSDLVNKMILCLLMSAGNTSACFEIIGPDIAMEVQRNGAAVEPQTAARVREPARRVFVASERIAIPAPTQKIRLAEETEIPLSVNMPGLTKVSTHQFRYPDGDRSRPAFIFGSDQELMIMQHTDGSNFVQVKPLRLGKVELRLVGVFPDGGIAQQKVMLEVEPPERQPERLVVGRTGTPNMNAGTIFLYADGKEGRSWLSVGARYEGVRDIIGVGLEFVKFEVRTAKGAPIVSLDEATGLLTPIKVGHALVKTAYGGVTNLTCVVVESTFDKNKYDHSRCEELLSPDEKLSEALLH